MGKQKKNCWKCGGQHIPPTRNKCEKTELLNITNSSSIAADINVDRSVTEKDSGTIPGTSKSGTASSTQGVHDYLKLQILEQLQTVSHRLDKVEDRMAEDHHGVKRQDNMRRKLSSFSKRHLTVVSDNSQSDSDSSDSEQYIPSLNSIRKSTKIQQQVDKRIRELEKLSESTGCVGKSKSKRGGGVEVVVKHRVAWPHEAILGGVTRSRLSYDQLTMSQWVQGFCKNVLDESDHNVREK